MIKKLLIMAAGIALATGLAACSAHHKQGKAEDIKAAQAQEENTVVVAEASEPAATEFTKGEY